MKDAQFLVEQSKDNITNILHLFYHTLTKLQSFIEKTKKISYNIFVILQSTIMKRISINDIAEYKNTIYFLKKALLEARGA